MGTRANWRVSHIGKSGAFEKRQGTKIPLLVQLQHPPLVVFGLSGDISNERSESFNG